MRVYVFCVITLWFRHVSVGQHLDGAIQFRISESEFNKVASVLTQSAGGYKINDEDDSLDGTGNNFSYQITDIVERSSVGTVKVVIPADGKVIAITQFPDVHLTGRIKLTAPTVHTLYDGEFDVYMKNVTVEAEDFVVSDEVVSLGSLHHLALMFSNCTSEAQNMSLSNAILQNIGLYITEDDLKDIFETAICHAYHLQFSLGFGAPSIHFTFDELVARSMEASSLQIKHETFLITQKQHFEDALVCLKLILVSTTFSDGAGAIPGSRAFPGHTAHPLPEFPPRGPTSEPFEIVFPVDIFNTIFHDFKRQLGIGVRKMKISDLIPVLPKKFETLDTDGFYMSFIFPTVRTIYPNATGTLLLSDADIYFKIKNGSVQLHFDTTCEMSVTLNCDKNRTFSAFNFTLNLFFPTQIGYDNKQLKLQILTFGGNFTILNSTVGHIVDRQLKSLIYSLPYFVTDKWDSFNDKIQGVSLSDMLPAGIHVQVKSISIVKDNVIVGGELSTTDPKLEQLNKTQINWIGEKVTDDDILLMAYDVTPEDPPVLKEKNCIKPPAISSGNYVALETWLVFLTVIVYSWH